MEKVLQGEIDEVINPILEDQNELLWTLKLPDCMSVCIGLPRDSFLLRQSLLS